MLLSSRISTLNRLLLGKIESRGSHRRFSSKRRDSRFHRRGKIFAILMLDIRDQVVAESN